MTETNTDQTLTGKFVEHVLAITFPSLPAKAIEVAKEVTLDGLAVMLAGATEPLGVGRISIEYVKAMGGVLSAQDLRNCEARIVPATEYNWRGRTLQLAGGLTAAPTMMRVLDQMASVQYGAKPDAAWYVAFARAMKTAPFGVTRRPRKLMSHSKSASRFPRC